MGRKQEPKEPETNEAAEEDTPIVKQLKEIDERYMALEIEYLKEVDKLRSSYDDKLRPMLEERSAKLRGESTEEVATPSLPKFWLEAFKHHQMIESMVLETDEPVLECLQDITQEFLDKDCSRKGMTLRFHFAPNKWFDHKVLSVTFKQDDEDKRSLWRNEEAPGLEVTCDPPKIEWKTGQDVTVEKIQKKVKGGGAKKAKQKKEKEEPRNSFFRFLFRTVKAEDDLPGDLEAMMKELNSDWDDEEDDDDDDSADTEDYLEAISQIVSIFSEQIIPFAVRWYTNEADPQEDIDFDEDEEEEEDDEDDDDDDDDSPKGGKKGGGRGRHAPKKKTGKSPKDSPATGPAADPKKEECKQQ